MASWLFALSALFLLTISSVYFYIENDKEETYTFEDFVKEYDKKYDSNEEKEHHEKIFQANLEKIQNHHLQNPSSSYQLGINHFMDLPYPPTGYDKSAKQHYHAPSHPFSSSRPRILSPSHPLFHTLLDDVSTLPSQIDWRSVSTPVKDQGMCGSCWAFASIATLESHLALQTSLLFSLSPQELVSCAPNPRQCGGNGGCTGSIAQLAYDFIAQHGILEEWEDGYQAYRGKDIPCPYNISNTSLLHPLPHSVAAIDGYIALPENNYTVLMNAVAKLGPVAVSVAADGWQFYQSGIFDRPFNASLPRTTDLDHAVVLVGYGTADGTGEDYWLVRNSWSPAWGEGGYIRLKREAFPGCGMDVTPGDGDACRRDEHGNPIIDPPREKICGTSGILYQGVIPLGVRLL